MTDRTLGYIIKDQKPLIMAENENVRDACRQMRKRRCGSVLVVDDSRNLTGIFTDRDAVRVLADVKRPKRSVLQDVMTPNPVTITPEHRAIDALREMTERGFRHIPIVENNEIWGVVSRGDFKGMEIDRLDEEEHLWETIR